MGDVIWVKPTTISDNLVVSLEQEPEVQGAVFSLEAKTGYVLAMEGGYDYEKSKFNRAVQAERQPGSSFKPIIYSAGVEKGYTPASIIVDSPIVYSDSETGKWRPNNFEEKFYGDTTFRQALIKSRNVPTIKIVQSLQIPFVMDYAKRLGLEAELNPDLSISLGSGNASLLQMTKTYAIFPRQGRKVDPIFITKVLDRNGKVLEERKPAILPANVKIPEIRQESPTTDSSSAVAANAGTSSAGANSKVIIPSYPPAGDPDQVMDPRVAYVMTHLMKEVVAFGTGHEAQNLGRPAAGKTGTTNDYIDAWFIGFTPHVVSGTWVGFDNRKPIGPGETGARAALPIWLNYMKEAVKSYPDEDFAVPPGVVFATIDSNTGKLLSPNAMNAIKEAFIEGTQPTEVQGNNKSAPTTQSDFFKEDVE